MEICLLAAAPFCLRSLMSSTRYGFVVISLVELVTALADTLILQIDAFQCLRIINLAYEKNVYTYLLKN